MKDTVDADIIFLMKDPASREEGFVLLMDTYKEPIYWHIRRLVVFHEDAEDILQETFIQVYRFADSFKGESKIYTWLYRIATNECTRFFRKQKVRKLNPEALVGIITGEKYETTMESSDAILIKFQQAIMQLSEKQRIVFNLRYYDELSYEDMSKILNSSVNTLKTNYHYAAGKIRQYLMDHA